MLLLKPPTPRPERVNLQVRVEKSFLELDALRAEFIGANRAYVVTESGNRLLERDHDLQSWLREAELPRGRKMEHSEQPTRWFAIQQMPSYPGLMLPL